MSIVEYSALQTSSSFQSSTSLPLLASLPPLPSTFLSIHSNAIILGGPIRAARSDNSCGRGSASCRGWAAGKYRPAGAAFRCVTHHVCVFIYYIRAKNSSGRQLDSVDCSIRFLLVVSVVCLMSHLFMRLSYAHFYSACSCSLVRSAFHECTHAHMYTGAALGGTANYSHLRPSPNELALVPMTAQVAEAVAAATRAAEVASRSTSSAYVAAAAAAARRAATQFQAWKPPRWLQVLIQYLFAQDRYFARVFHYLSSAFIFGSCFFKKKRKLFENMHIVLSNHFLVVRYYTVYVLSQGKTLKQYADMASQGDQHPMLLRARLAPPTTTEIGTSSAQVYEATEKAAAEKAAAEAVAAEKAASEEVSKAPVALVDDFPFSSSPAAMAVASASGGAVDTLEIDPAQRGSHGGGENSNEHRSTSRSREDGNNSKGQQHQKERRTSTAVGGSRKEGNATKSGQHSSRRSSSRSSARRGSSRSTSRRRSKSSSSSTAAAAAAAAAGMATGAAAAGNDASSGKKSLPFGCFGSEGFGWGSNIVPLRAREMWLEKPAGQFGSFPVQVWHDAVSTKFLIFLLGD